MAEAKSLVPFACQKCSEPLHLGHSLNFFSERIWAELNLSIHSNSDVDLESQATSFDHCEPSFQLSDSEYSFDGFMLISNENIDLLGFKYKIKAALFDIVSGNSNIDHPLCDECADKLIEILDEQLKITQEDYDDYRKYYKILQNEKDIPKLNDLEKELGDLIAEEKRLVNELEVLRKEEEKTMKAIKEQKAISKKITEEEQKSSKEYARCVMDSKFSEEEEKSLAYHLKYIKVQLDNLQGKDVFTAAFHIWYNGHLGTINNFRLGRLPSVPVDWSEINAAWGQTTLLLSALAGTINLTFERYKLVPYANHSYIEVIGEQKKLPLYGSGGFKFVRNTEFDSGMVAFLDCLQQFQDKVANLDKDTVFRFPYRTNKGKIGDKDASYSIRIQLNSEEQWTKALKFVLTNLKWGVTFVASLSKSDGDEILQSDN